MRISKFTLNPIEENIYILWDESSKDAVIIDAGMMNMADCNIIDNFIYDNHLNLKRQLYTHLHIDHCAGASHITQKYELIPEYAKEEEILGAQIQQQANGMGLCIQAPSLKGYKELKEGDVILLGVEQIKCIQVPGHSPGSILFYAPLSSALFSGDVLFQNSIGRTDLLGGNFEQLVEGIHKKILPLPEDTIVYPGHGDNTTIYDEKKYNPFLK